MNALPLQFKAVGIALLVASAALSTSFGAARILRHEALRDSHQQPLDEKWPETATPTSPELVKHGRALFLDSCAHCHGADARGDEGPDLHAVQVSDRYIANIVTHGIKGEMPSFAKKHGRDDITALTAYVRSLE
jgi:mono/diheme cytochrome c family protein